MAAERKVSMGYQNSLKPLGLNGTSSKSSARMYAGKLKLDAFCSVPIAPSIHSPTRNNPDRARPRANPAWRFTQSNVSGRVQYRSLGFRSERSRINSHKLASSRESICGRTPHNGRVAKAAKRAATPATKGFEPQRKYSRRNAPVITAAKVIIKPAHPAV